MMDNRYLISGTSGGLGKYLHEEVGGDIYNREYKNEHSSKKYETIIHCAFKRPTIHKDENYIKEQLNISREIASIRHEKFIFISTIDIYSNQLNDYGRAKVEIEKMLRKKGENRLIVVRPPMLIGKYMKANTPIRILREINPKLNLTKDSTINMVFYEDIKKICTSYKGKDINLMNSENIKLEQIAKRIKRSPNWGNYKYDTVEPRLLNIESTPEMRRNNQIERLIKETKNYVQCN